MDEPLARPSPPRASASAESPGKTRAPVTSLSRQDVIRTVDAGLGYFLQRLSVEPMVVDAKFQGFRILALEPQEFWEGVDLKPGDVVMQVNGMPIERDIDAYNAFQSLRTAPALRVTLLRGGEQREIVYPITGEPKPASTPSPAKP